VQAGGHVPLSAAAILATLAAGLAGPASTSAWTKPRTLVAAASPDALGAGLVQSPDGTATDAFSVTEHGGIRLFPARGGSSFEAPVYVPGSRPLRNGLLPPPFSVALGDGGSAAVVWVDQIDEAGGDRPCLCAVRAATRAPREPFGPMQTLVRARQDMSLPQVASVPQSGATAVWRQGGVERWARSSGTGFGRPHSLPGAQWTVLSAVAGRPEIYFLGGELGEEEIYEGSLPLHRPRFLGPVPAPEVGPGETKLAADSHGDLIAVGAESRLKVSYRRTGRHLGRPRTLAHLGEGDSCSVAATMNVRGEALVAWACSSGRSFGESGEAVLLGPGGRLLAASRRRTVAGAPVIALGPRGDALVAWELSAAHGIVVATQQRRGRSFGPDRPILRARDAESIEDLSLAIDGRTGLALWTDDVPLPGPERRLERVRVASTTLE